MTQWELLQMSDTWNETAARDIIAPFLKERGGLLPALHGLQDAFGFVSPEATPFLAEAFNLTRAEVHGVVTYYHDFRSQPPEKRIVKVCRAEACQAVGGRELAAHAEEKLGTEFGSSSASEQIALEEVYCLGNCACAPSVMVDGLVYGKVTPERFDTLLTAAGDVPQPTATGEPGATKVYVPRDTTAISMGAHDVAAEIERQAKQRGVSLEVIRNGSRGACWLEPLVEVETPEGRIAYGPITSGDVVSLFEAEFFEGGNHGSRLGDITSHSYFAEQDRQTLGRCGFGDPLSLETYQSLGGFEGFKKALNQSPQKIVGEIEASGLRGRGGAAFPAHIKWQTVLDQKSSEKFITCNADEGDSGTFSDRILMEGDPYCLIEGMLIAAHAVGATSGYIYLRSEYPVTKVILAEAIERAREAGWLGENILGSGLNFDITLRIGAGSYVCGEETAMLESLEGKRGIVRAKPPLPAIEGLFGLPTLVHNVITLASVPEILVKGGGAYGALGAERSRGTLPVQLAGNVKRGGVVEVPFGTPLRELVEGYGGGTASGLPIKALQIGGPLGAYLPASALDLPLDYEAIAGAGGLLGHGGIVVFDETVDMWAQARFAMEFCVLESCGKCTPCRIGSVRGVEVIDRLATPEGFDSNLALLEDLLETMEDGSLCAMGGLTPLPVKSALRHFPEDFRKPRQAAE
jgi:formate dehydrogenase iron-sulfur subunit